VVARIQGYRRLACLGRRRRVLIFTAIADAMPDVTKAGPASVPAR
jgi:hypothetical protein